MIRLLSAVRAGHSTNPSDHTKSQIRKWVIDELLVLYGNRKVSAHHAYVDVEVLLRLRAKKARGPQAALGSGANRYSFVRPMSAALEDKCSTK